MIRAFIIRAFFFVAAPAFCVAATQGITAEGLILHWAAWSGNSALIEDSSGYGNDGFFITTLFPKAKINQQAIELDGLKDRILLKTGDRLKFTGGEITITAWIMPSADGEGRILSKPWNGEGQYNYGIDYTGDEAIRLTLMEGDRNFSLKTPPNSVPSGVWTHVAVKATYYEAIIYLNGLRSAAKKHLIHEWKPSKGDVSVPFTVGCIYPYPETWPGDRRYCFGGLIRDLRVYNLALDSLDIKTLYVSTVNQSSSIRISVNNRNNSTEPCSGEVVLEAHIFDAASLPCAKLILNIDGIDTPQVLRGPPYTFKWDSRTETNGLHSLAVKCIGTDGNVSISEELTLLIGNNSSKTFKEVFPRIAVAHNVNQFFDKYVVDLSKADITILNFDRNWHKGKLTAKDILAGIKKHNPNILIGQYTLLNEVMTPYHDPLVFRDIYEKLAAEKGPRGNGDWWARTGSGDSIHVYKDSRSINITAFVMPDITGDRYPEWLAKREYNSHFLDNPEFDIWFIDNVVHAPYIDADWDGDGKSDSRFSPDVQRNYRWGFKNYFNAIRALTSSVMLMGNSGDSGPSGFLSTPEYKHQLEMAFYENVHNTTWDNFIEGYRRLTENTRFPHVVVISMYGGLKDYSLARYWLAATLMGDGYFHFGYDTANQPVDKYIPVMWLDEFDLAGAGNSGWLGKAIDPPQHLPWQKGVYRRKFEKGMTLVNPIGNGRQIVTLEPGYSRFEGKQQPTINDGKTVTSISISDGSGILLVKEDRKH
jgi:hypothetical protein